METGQANVYINAGGCTARKAGRGRQRRVDRSNYFREAISIVLDATLRDVSRCSVALIKVPLRYISEGEISGVRWLSNVILRRESFFKLNVTPPRFLWKVLLLMMRASGSCSPASAIFLATASDLLFVLALLWLLLDVF